MPTLWSFWVASSVSKQAVLFLKKKNQKNFYPFGTRAVATRVPVDKSFLLLFFRKEGPPCFG
jgi:hypothetical protein